MSELVNKVAEILKAPIDLVQRSAEARAVASGKSVDEVLNSWAGGESVEASAPVEEAPKEEAPVEEAPVEEVVEEIVEEVVEEIENEVFPIRTHGGGDLGKMKINDFIKYILKKSQETIKEF